MTDKQIIIDDLIKQLNEKTVVIMLLRETLDRKEQECEELKEKYKWYDHYKEQALYNKNLCNEKSEQLDQLKQTLIEIKEIAEKAKKDICNNCGWRNTDNYDPEDYTCGEFIKILQKISKVENAR